jgi:hypothetical protein
VLDIEKVSSPPGPFWDFGATLRFIYSEKAGQKRFRFYGYPSGAYFLVDRQISIISKIPFRNRYLDIQLRFSYIPLIQKPRLYLPILSYHRLI